MWPNIFTEIASVLAVAVAVGAIGLWLRQPLIISFIVVGILAIEELTKTDETDVSAFD